MRVATSNTLKNNCADYQEFNLFNLINDAIILLNPRTQAVLFMNEMALKLYQYTPEDMPTLSLGHISHDSASLTHENMNLTKQYINGYIFTANHKKKDGSLFKVEVTARYVKFRGNEIVSSTIRNLTPHLKIREDIELAGKVQRRSLPQDLDETLFCTRSIYQPHNYVSGDLYDFIFDSNKKILHGILIDVMGHGIAAAFQTSILRYLFGRVKKKTLSINDKLAWINKKVQRFFSDGDFVGVFLFELDFKHNTLHYSAGGINHFIILKEQGPEIVKAPGLFLGIDEKAVFDQGIYHFETGESFLFLTDGLFEMIAQPLSSHLDFWSMQDTCNLLVSNKSGLDDASGIGILIL